MLSQPNNKPVPLGSLVILSSEHQLSILASGEDVYDFGSIVVTELSKFCAEVLSTNAGCPECCGVEVWDNVISFSST